MGRNRRGMPRRMDAEKTLRADDGRVIRVSQILACLQTGPRCCEGIVHKLGSTTFSGRSFDRMPRIKFNHCTSKFFPGRAAWQPPAEEKRAVPESMVLPAASAAPVEAREPVAEVAAEQAAAPVVAAATEERMNAQKTTERARRFNNEKDGPMLLEAVRVHQRDTGLKIKDGTGQFWVNFARYAARSDTLREWGGDAICWARRYRAAAHRFSEAGKVQHEQGLRVRALAKAQGVSMTDLYSIMGNEGGSASDQVEARRPWRLGVLAELAKLFKVSEDYLRYGQEVVPVPVPQAERAPEQLKLPEVAAPGPGPEPDVQVGAAQRYRVTFPGGASVTQDDVAELERLRTAMRKIEQMLETGVPVVHGDVLRMLIAYTRGEDVMDTVIALLLAAK